jgi:hypothetical protein
MNVDRPAPALRVPTLTEVVPRTESDALDLSLDEPLHNPAGAPESDRGGPGELATMGPAEANLVAQLVHEAPASVVVPLPVQRSEAQITQHVLADVQRQVELMLEYRMREALAPILARATDMLIRDVRTQLSHTLHEMVARAVAQELARHRDR